MKWVCIIVVMHLAVILCDQWFMAVGVVQVLYFLGGYELIFDISYGVVKKKRDLIK